MSSLVQSDIFEVEGLTGVQLVPVCKMDTTFSIQWHHFQSKMMKTSVRLSFRTTSIFSRRNKEGPRTCFRRGRRHQLSCAQRQKFQRPGVTAQHDQEERAHAPSTRQLQFLLRFITAITTTKYSGQAFRVRPGVSNFPASRGHLIKCWNLRHGTAPRRLVTIRVSSARISNGFGDICAWIRGGRSSHQCGCQVIPGAT